MSEPLSIHAAAEALGPGITPANARARIRRGSLEALKDEHGEWRVPVAAVERAHVELGACVGCSKPATRWLIVKYPHHERVEGALCDGCAGDCERAYEPRGGVLEVVSYPLLGEGWVAGVTGLGLLSLAQTVPSPPEPAAQARPGRSGPPRG